VCTTTTSTCCSNCYQSASTSAILSICSSPSNTPSIPPKREGKCTISSPSSFRYSPSSTQYDKPNVNTSIFSHLHLTQLGVYLLHTVITIIHRFWFLITLIAFTILSLIIIALSFFTKHNQSPIRRTYIRQHRVILFMLVLLWACPIASNILIQQ
jgi:hypothetical protein